MGVDILIVDDDPDIRDALSQAFELEGYHVALAVNGRDALEQLRAGLAPSLVLLDLMMPVMNGAELLECLRADPRFERLPVVLVTAFGARAPAYRDQIQGFLAKPVDLDTLLGLVTRFCQVRRS